MSACNAGDLCGKDPLEKEMATHSSILAWKTPWMEKPGGLQSMESQRVRRDWVTSLSLANFLFIYFILYWDIVDLQCCISFRHVAKWSSCTYTSLVAQLVKNLSVMWETWVWSLGWEDPLEMRTGTYSSILAWRNPRTVYSMGHKSQTWLSDFHFHIYIHYFSGSFFQIGYYKTVPCAIP